jgi:NitT/TauT family transport system ATP-binding protein
MMDSPPPPSIQVVGVGRVFDGGVRALHDVTLDIAAGSLTVLVGVSGCGKTTLLRIIGGLDAASEGHVTIARAGDGAEGSGAPVRISFGFQEPRLLPWRSVQRNVELPLELAGVPRQERARRAADMIGQVGLAEAAERLPAQLSGGMRMRAAIARALVTGPRVLLLDEPFGALDEITRQTMGDLLLGLWRAFGMTVVMVTHSIAEAVYVGQRVVVMGSQPGRVLHQLSPELGDRVPALRGTAEFAATVARVYGHLESVQEAAR